MNWLRYANHHRLTLFFNLKRSVIEHKICQWWLFTCLTLFWLQISFFKKLGLGSDACYCKMLRSSCWAVPSLRAEDSGCEGGISQFEVSNSKMSLANWHPQTCLLQSACQRYCSEAKLVKAEDAWFRLQWWGITLSLSEELEVTKEFSTLWDFRSLSGSSCP